MRKLRILLPLLALLLAILSCEGSEDINFGIGIETCDHKCGEYTFCQTSRGDLDKNDKVDVSFPYGGVKKDGTRDYAEDAKSVNATLTVKVEGEGTVDITVKPITGESFSVTASSGNPAVLTADFPLEFKKERASDISDDVESAQIVGIHVETVGGPAIGVQLNLVVNECTDPWCSKTHPNCSGY